MAREPVPFSVTRAQMNEVDRRAVMEFGIAVEALMENAGKAVADESIRMLQRFESRGRKSVLVVCGSGNNGGDGLVAARLLHLQDAPVKVMFLKPPSTMKGAAAANFARMKKLQIPYAELPDLAAFHGEVSESSLLVDAVLGTGFSGRVALDLGKYFASMNVSEKPILAVDVPSGLDADTGEAASACVRATATVTMGALKKGFLQKNAQRYLGRVTVADIGFPKELLPPPA